MFAGHIGAALALSRTEPRINLGLWVGAAVFSDLLLWGFALAGWEAVRVPADYAVHHQLAFECPYSHSLAASFGWAVLVGLTGSIGYGGATRARLRSALLLVGAVMSHWLLDALVHRPDLPLLVAGTREVGLSLWDHRPAALAFESLFTLGGLALYLSTAGMTRTRSVVTAGFTLLIVAMTIFGMTLSPAPASGAQVAGSSLVSLLLTIGVFGWLDRGRGPSARRI